MGGNRVLKGVTGGKRILLHCRGPYMYKRLRGKRVPPAPKTKEKQREGASKNG